jgi:hypothetical protein
VIRRTPFHRIGGDTGAHGQKQDCHKQEASHTTMDTAFM